VIANLEVHLAEDILKWCSKDLRRAALVTGGRTEWRKFVASPNDPRWSLVKKKKKKK